MTFLTETDKYIYERDIAPFLPSKIIDIHTHIDIARFMPDRGDSQFGDVTVDVVKQWWKMLLPDALVTGNIMGFPRERCDIQGQNEYLANNIGNEGNVFSLLVSPDVSIDKLEADIVNYKPFALKPYLCFSVADDHSDARITEFMPEEQFELANRYNLAVVIHVSRARGMADKQNLDDISRQVKKYPNCNFILAHCGRCFVSINAEDMLQEIPVAENLWIDTSAVCDMGVFMHLFTKYDHSKILYGSDLVTAAGFRGSYVPMGMSWIDFSGEQSKKKLAGIAPTIAAYQNLAAMLQAATFCKFSKAMIEDIFYNNAKRLLSKI
ncbi:MAG: amidohydrolase family protein [Sedimentisphaeraceae bacterium JB056]